MGRPPKRFPLDLELHYLDPEPTAPFAVLSGRTLEVSGRELSFIAERLPRIGQSLQVFIDWPVLLDEHIKLQLIISGTVVQTQGTMVVLKIQRHDFRTRGVRHRSAAPPPG